MANIWTKIVEHFAGQKGVILEALEMMGTGMVGIFVALIIIMIFVWIMAIIGGKKK